MTSWSLEEESIPNGSQSLCHKVALFRHCHGVVLFRHSPQEALSRHCHMGDGCHHCQVEGIRYI